MHYMHHAATALQPSLRQQLVQLISNLRTLPTCASTAYSTCHLACGHGAAERFNDTSSLPSILAVQQKRLSIAENVVLQQDPQQRTIAPSLLYNHHNSTLTDAHRHQGSYHSTRLYHSYNIRATSLGNIPQDEQLQDNSKTSSSLAGTYQTKLLQQAASCRLFATFISRIGSKQHQTAQARTKKHQTAQAGTKKHQTAQAGTSSTSQAGMQKLLEETSTDVLGHCPATTIKPGWLPLYAQPVFDVLVKEAGMLPQTARNALQALIRHNCSSRRVASGNPLWLSTSNTKAWIQWFLHQGAEPAKALQRYPYILETRCDPNAASARVQLLQAELQVPQQLIINMLQKGCQFLAVRQETVVGCLAFVQRKLRWSHEQVVRELGKFPALLGCTADKLDRTHAAIHTAATIHLQWTAQQASFVISRHSMTLHLKPASLVCNIEAWANYGTDHELNVASLLYRNPSLLTINLESKKIRTRLEWLQQVWCSPLATVLTTVPEFLSYDLLKRVGPRYSLTKLLGIEYALTTLCRNNNSAYMTRVIRKAGKVAGHRDYADASSAVQQCLLELPGYSACMQQQIAVKHEATASNKQRLNANQDAHFSDELLLLRAYIDWWQQSEEGRVWVEKFRK